MARTSGVAGDRLRDDLERALARAAGRPVRVIELAPLVGGASQEAWAVEVEVSGGPEAGRHALVLRRDLGGTLSSAVLPREQEFAVLAAMHRAGLPVPRPYWFLPDLGGRAAFLMARIEGETIGRRIVQAERLAAARDRLPVQMGEVLAAIHAVQPAAHGLNFLWRPAAGQSAAEARLDQLAADLEAIDEPHPALELGLRWLRRQAPPAGPLVAVHGDFRVGNFVVGPEGLRAVLDWENVHLSDPHADLGWCCLRAWRFGRDSLAAGGIGERQVFFDAYVRASGRQVDPVRAAYWEILGNLQWAIGALGQARRHLSGRQPSLELASLGRISAEMELEMLDLIECWEAAGPTAVLNWERRHAG